MSLFTQEDLNALNQLIRIFRPLERLSGVLQNYLIAEEETANIQRAGRTAAKELGGLQLEIAATQESHKTALINMEAQRDEKLKQIQSQIDFQREQEQRRLADWIKETTTSAETSLKLITDKISIQQAELKSKLQEESNLDETIQSLDDKRIELEAKIADLDKTKQQHDAEISALFKRLQGN